LEDWIEQLGKRHRELARHGYVGRNMLWQKERLWEDFFEACQIAVNNYSSWFGSAVFLASQPSVEKRRICNVAEFKPDNASAVITFDEVNGTIEIKDIRPGGTARFMLAFDPENAVRLVFEGQLLNAVEAARAALAPVLFGIGVYFRRWADSPSAVRGQRRKTIPDGVWRCRADGWRSPMLDATPRVFVSSVIEGFEAMRQFARGAIREAGAEPVLVNEDLPSLAASSRNLGGIRAAAKAGNSVFRLSSRQGRLIGCLLPSIVRVSLARGSTEGGCNRFQNAIRLPSCPPIIITRATVGKGHLPFCDNQTAPLQTVKRGIGKSCPGISSSGAPGLDVNTVIQYKTVQHTAAFLRSDRKGCALSQGRRRSLSRLWV